MLPTFSLVFFLAVPALQTPDEPGVQTILKALSTGTKEERQSAVGMLNLLTLEQAARFVTPVQNLLSSNDPQERNQGVEAVRVLRLKELGPALRPLLKTPDLALQSALILAISENHLEDLYPALLDLYKTGSPEVRWMAAERLGAASYPPAAAPLLAGLQSDDLILLNATATAVGRLRLVRAFPTLLTLLNHKDDAHRSFAAQALGWLGDKKAIPPLRAHLADPGSNVRWTTALSLSFLGAKEAIPELTKRLADPDVLVRAAAATALSNLDAKGIAGDLVKLLDDPEPWVVQAAYDALAALEAKEALPRVLDRLRLPSLEVARLAIPAAARIGGAAALDRMKDLWSHDDSQIRMIARSATFEIAPPDMMRARIKELAADPGYLVNIEGLHSLTLNRIRLPAVWEKLRAIPLEGDLIGSPKEVAELIAKQAKMELVPPEIRMVHDQSWTLGRIEVRNPVRRLSALDGLYHLVTHGLPGRTVPVSGLGWTGGSWTVVLEKDQLRFLSTNTLEDPGRVFWKVWIETAVLPNK